MPEDHDTLILFSNRILLKGKTKHTRIVAVLAFSLLFHQSPFAQNLSDTLCLSEVEIKASFPLDNQGFKKVRIDSTLLVPHLNSDLSTILTQYSTVFIKSYGNGSLATPAFRGTTANHTQVEWNGISINSPMLGQSDLSQVPVGQFDGIEILYGAAGISRTSGAFGGVINLVTDPDWNNRIHSFLALTAGSFDTYSANAGLEMGNRNLQSVLKFNYTSSLNDFPYYNDYTQSEEKLINSAYTLFGISEEVFYRVNDRNFLSARIWYNQGDRDIPPITTNTSSSHNEHQYDHSLRSIWEWKYLRPRFNLSVRSAIVDQFLHYTNDSINSRHQTYSWINRIRAGYTGVKNLSLKPGLDVNFDWVISDAYDSDKTRTTLGLFVETGYSIVKKVELSLVLRQDIIDGDFLPFIPAFGIQYKPFDRVNLAFSANVSRNYRYPTLNDLYWSVSGNPDLEPETDYACEAGIVYHYETPKKNFFIETVFSGYYSRMIDLIMWTPVEGNSSLWKPMNINEVLARGVEAGLNLKVRVWGIQLSWDNNYNFCRSTYEKTRIPDDPAIGNQLIYIPEHTLNSTLALSKWNFFLSVNNTFTSRRYTGTDNATYMPAYDLINFIFGKNFHLKKILLSLQLQINNLFDLDYQSIANRPMPGRNFAFTLKCDFRN